MQRPGNPLFAFAWAALFGSVMIAFALSMRFDGPAEAATSSDVSVEAYVTDSKNDAATTLVATIPESVPVQDAPVTITLKGLTPLSYVEVFAQSQPILIASGFADAKGVFEAYVYLPAALEVGDHKITATIQLAGEPPKNLVLVSFTVTEAGTVGKVTKGDNGKPVATNGPIPTYSGGGKVSPSPTPSEAQPTPSSAVEPMDNFSGVLLVGGLTVISDSEFKPEGAPAEFEITVSNIYTAPVDMKVEFKLADSFGSTYSTKQRVQRIEIQPGETRQIVSVTKTGIGQLGLYKGTVDITPQSEIDGIKLKSFQRQQDIFVFPAMIITIILIIFGAFVVRRVVLFTFMRRRFASQFSDDYKNESNTKSGV